MDTPKPRTPSRFRACGGSKQCDWRVTVRIHCLVAGRHRGVCLVDSSWSDGRAFVRQPELPQTHLHPRQLSHPCQCKPLRRVETTRRPTSASRPARPRARKASGVAAVATSSISVSAQSVGSADAVAASDPDAGAGVAARCWQVREVQRRRCGGQRQKRRRRHKRGHGSQRGRRGRASHCRQGRPRERAGYGRLRGRRGSTA